MLLQAFYYLKNYLLRVHIKRFYASKVQIHLIDIIRSFVIHKAIFLRTNPLLNQSNKIKLDKKTMLP